MSGDKKQQFFISYAIAVIAVILAAGSYIYTGIVADAALEPLLPKSYARVLVRESQQFRRIRGAYPVTFDQLKEVSQVVRNAKWVGGNTDRITWHNYRYVLVNLPGDRLALWAFPDGDYRVLGNAFCVIAGVGWARVWMRRALSDEGIKALPRVPTNEALLEARFQEVELGKLE